MSLYAEFLPDAKVVMYDLGVPGQTADGSLTFRCMISEPQTSQQFGEGGFSDKVGHSVRIVAETAAWSLPDGTAGASGPVIVANAVVASLGYGRKLLVNGKGVRITQVTYKRTSAWVTLQVMDDGA
jgi:hypothetical protein